MKFIKLITSILLAVSLVLGVAACEEKKADDEEKTEEEGGEEAEGEGAEEGGEGAEEGGEGDEAGAEEGDETAAAEEEGEDEPEAGTVVLEEVEIASLGNVLLPKGYEETRPATEKNGHYKFPLSEDGMKSLRVDWEMIDGAGATTVEEGDKLIGILIGNGEVQEQKDLGDGRVMYVAGRESDDYTWTVVFNKNGYLKCTAPEAHSEHCAKITQSLDPVAE